MPAGGRAQRRQLEWHATLHAVIVFLDQSIWGLAMASQGEPRTASDEEDSITNR